MVLNIAAVITVLAVMGAALWFVLHTRPKKSQDTDPYILPIKIGRTYVIKGQNYVLMDYAADELNLNLNFVHMDEVKRRYYID